MVNIVFAVGKAFDNWIVEYWNEFSQNNIEQIADQCVDILKRVEGTDYIWRK